MMTCRGQPRTLAGLQTACWRMVGSWRTEISLISGPGKYPSWQLQTELEMRHQSGRGWITSYILPLQSGDKVGLGWGILDSFSQPSEPVGFFFKDLKRVHQVSFDIVYMKYVTTVIDVLTQSILANDRDPFMISRVGFTKKFIHNLSPSDHIRPHYQCRDFVFLLCGQKSSHWLCMNVTLVVFRFNSCKSEDLMIININLVKT